MDSIHSNSRRSFLKKLGAAGATLVGSQLFAKEVSPSSALTSSSQTYLGGFIAPKLAHIKVAFIGVGARGINHAIHLASFEGTEVVGICDLYEDLCQRAEKYVKSRDSKRHDNLKLYFGSEQVYKKMLAETKPDLVYIATPWEWHVPMAIDAMEAGAHACVEVPLSTSIADSWKLIEVAQRCQKHCMMLENVNYGREELMYLNMCRQGVLGELLHGEASYIHELRFQMADVEKGRGTGFWRTRHWANDTGNLYPTHGLGPIAQYMNIARTDDMFSRIVSFSSPSKNHALYAKENFAPDSPLNKMNYKCGDMSTSIIKTALGRTILVEWDESSPRPYSRKNLIQGTRGTAAGFPTRIAMQGGVEGITKDHHSWAQGDALEPIFEKYDHPLYKRTQALAKKLGGHGGMDAIMNFRVIECLQKGEPLDQNLYEGCFWSAVTPLSAKSVAEGGMPQEFPDFTCGQWKTTQPLGIVS